MLKKKRSIKLKNSILFIVTQVGTERLGGAAGGAVSWRFWWLGTLGADADVAEKLAVAYPVISFNVDVVKNDEAFRNCGDSSR